MRSTRYGIPDQFAFGFDDVERRSVQFSRNRDDEHHERHDAQTNQVPVQMPWDCEVTMLWIDSDPVTSTTVTIVMPRRLRN